jgi:hypothetical protein
MRKNIFFYLLVILSTIFMTDHLRSDDFFAVKDRIIEENRFKLGFLYFTPLLMLENAGYTSSVYTYEAQEVPDWTGDIGLGLRTSAVLANRLILQAEGLPHYSYYLENKNLRSWSNRFEATAYSYIGPLNLKAGYARSDQNQRPQLEFSRPFHYISHEWLGETDIGRHSSFFFTIYARFRKLAYDENPYMAVSNLAESLDQRENVFGFRLNRRVFTSTFVYANYEMNDYIFAARTERDAHAQTLTIGVDFPEIGILQGSLQVGMKQFDPANPLYKPMRRPSGRGDIRLTLMERLRLSLFYELQTYFSYGASDLFYDNQSYGGGAEVYLTNFLKGGASYREGRLKYFSFFDLELQRSDRLRQQRYYLAIPFLGNTSLGVAYNIYRLTSDVLVFDTTRKFWGGFISYEF